MGGAPAKDIAAFNKSVYDILKPGGTLMIVGIFRTDRVSFDVAGMRRKDRLDDPVLQAVKGNHGENDTLKNPADDHNEKVFEQGIRDHTDQFILKFHKP